MKKALSIDLSGMDLGTVPLIDFAGLPIPASERNIADQQLRNPLSLVNNGNGPVLRYRYIQSGLREGDLSAYNIDLGVIAAASSVIFLSPLVGTPPTMTLLMLLQNQEQAEEEGEGVSAILVEPARDGSLHNARIADEAQQEALLTGKAKANVKPTEQLASSLPELINRALEEDAVMEITVAVPRQALVDIEMKLPEAVTFDDDGAFYFRDVLDGEGNLLLNDEESFANLHFMMKIISGGYFYRLEDDEETVPEYLFDPETADEDEFFTEFNVLAEKAEAELSRLVVIVSGDEMQELLIEFEVYSGDQFIFSDTIVRESVATFADTELIDTTSGLPEHDFARDSGVSEDDDFDNYPLEIL